MLSTAIPTVVRVTWAATAEESWVEFGPDTGYGQVGLADGAGAAVLVGSHADTDVHFRLATEGGLAPGEDHVIHTGARPDTLPVPTRQEGDSDVDWGAFLLLPVLNVKEGRGDVVLIDRTGEVVWWTGVDLFPSAAFVGLDGDVLFRTDGAYAPGGGVGGVYAVDWVGEGVRELLVDDLGHHDFMELADGTLTTIEHDVREWEGEDVVGDRLVEHAPDGTETEVWNAWDTLNPVIPEAPVYSPIGTDWTHVNGIDYDPVTDRYLASLFFERRILAIERSTGAVVWSLGGDSSDWELVDELGFGPQHAPTFVEGGVMFFDNHGEAGVDEDSPSSRAVRYGLDSDAGTATVEWSWTPEPDEIIVALGDVVPLADGNVMVTNGIGGVAQVVAEERKLLFSVAMPEGQPIARGVVLGADLRPR